MSIQFSSTHHFVKVPSGLAVTIDNLLLKVIPTLVTLAEQFEAMHNFDLSPLFEEATYPDPENPDIIPNRQDPPDLFIPLNPSSATYTALTPDERKEVRENEALRLAHNNYIQQQWKLFTLGQSLLKAEFDKFIPLHHPYRVAIGGVDGMNGRMAGLSTAYGLTERGAKCG
jgi:hypothetical protein